MTYVDVTGWAGAVLILFAFYRTSIGKWTGKSFWYELDNLLGSSFLLFYAYQRHSYVTIVLNGIWAVAAVRGLTSAAERSRNRVKKSKKMSAHSRAKLTGKSRSKVSRKAASAIS